MLPRLDSGVSGYIVEHATVTVQFPIDFRGNATICCDACDFYSRSSKRCKLTGKLSEYPERYVGSQCPLEYEEKEQSNG